MILKALSLKDDCMKAHLRSVCSDEVDRLWLVLLPLWCVRADHLPDGHRVSENPRDKPLQTVGDLIHTGVGLPSEFPPGTKHFNIPLLSLQREEIFKLL